MNAYALILVNLRRAYLYRCSGSALTIGGWVALILANWQVAAALGLLACGYVLAVKGEAQA